jgi:hypothetical protein
VPVAGHVLGLEHELDEQLHHVAHVARRLREQRGGRELGLDREHAAAERHDRIGVAARLGTGCRRRARSASSRRGSDRELAQRLAAPARERGLARDERGARGVGLALVAVAMPSARGSRARGDLRGSPRPRAIRSATRRQPACVGRARARSGGARAPRPSRRAMLSSSASAARASIRSGASSIARR